MDQRATANVAEMVEANSNIETLKQQLAAAMNDLTNWKVVFDVEVIPSGTHYDIRVAASAGGKVFNYMISQGDALYFNDDKATIIHMIAQRMVVELLTDTAVNALSSKLTNAITNVHKLASSKGFA
jgi:hypothetical protein